MIDLPTTTFLTILTPFSFKPLISLSKTVLGSLKGGIPYLKTPPVSWSASKMVTSKPAFLRSLAALMPAQPEPTIATFLPFGVILTSTGSELSPTYLSSAPIATGVPLIPKTHFDSHCLSCGQTLPQTDGNIFVSLIISPAFCIFPFLTS